MDENISKIIVSVLVLVIGLYCLINYKSLGTKGTIQQQKILKSMGIRINFAEKSIKGFQYGTLIFGILFTTSALLSLLETMRTK